MLKATQLKVTATDDNEANHSLRNDGYHGIDVGVPQRDQMAYGYVLEANGKLCVDAVEGSATKKNTSSLVMWQNLSSEDIALSFN
ncbi:hypothetical protein LSH36_427g02055 [Paralvinella palmiformis]|uniref:Uncharacterized protein n=1 Tax=Paralvinella palmiformis TaxID=53620 RepID=A0AAD9N0R8_9ANNE|nr:hypothetical protein LSH36_427g02055 [Paralvinella palmiformis]